jgi:hypothetical protein
MSGEQCSYFVSWETSSRDAAKNVVDNVTNMRDNETLPTGSALLTLDVRMSARDVFDYAHHFAVRRAGADGVVLRAPYRLD